MKELKDEDVRGLDERLMTECEKAEREHRIATGTQTDHDALGGIIVRGALADSKHSLLWIWITFSSR